MDASSPADFLLQRDVKGIFDSLLQGAFVFLQPRLLQQQLLSQLLDAGMLFDRPIQIDESSAFNSSFASRLLERLDAGFEDLPLHFGFDQIRLKIGQRVRLVGVSSATSWQRGLCRSPAWPARGRFHASN